MKFFILNIKNITCVFILLVLISCKIKNEYREYVEIKKGGGKFGKIEQVSVEDNSSVYITGKVSEIEEKLTTESQNKFDLSPELLQWEVPSTWQEQSGNNVRLATLVTSSLEEVTLVSFPGNAGGLRSNLKRWLRQINLNLSSDKISKIIDDFRVEKSKFGLKYIIVDFESLEPIKDIQHENSILVAILKFQNQTLFVKIQGTIQIVEQERSRFIGLIKSLKIKK